MREEGEGRVREGLAGITRGKGRERGDPKVVSKGKNEHRASCDNPLALSEGKAPANSKPF